MFRMNFIVPPNDGFGGAAVDGKVIGNVFSGTAIVNGAGPWGNGGTICDGDMSIVDLAKTFFKIRPMADDSSRIDYLLEMANIQA